MMNRTTATAASVLVLAALGLVACGQQASVPGAPGQTAESSLEPIDAVPLPLDDNPLTPPPATEPAPRAEAKTDDKAEAETESAAAPITVASPEKASTTAATAAEPAPRPRVAPAPAPREASPPPPEKSEPEKPVLNF